MRINRSIPSAPAPRTHEGAPAKRISPLLQLRRLVLSCMLFEDGFYVDGKTVADQIEDAVAKVTPDEAMRVAIEARSKGNLRHAPLWVARVMAGLKKHREYVAQTLKAIIQRVDEIPEFLAIYFSKKGQKESAQVKKGLASAFQKFNEYQLAKYNRDGQFTLKDALFICHAKPKDKEQEHLWKKLIGGFCETCWCKKEDHETEKETRKSKTAKKSRRKAGEPCNNFVEAKLAIPDTWEVALSAGADKKATFSRLIAEGKLGGLALLRNLRNMEQAGVDRKVIKEAIKNMKTDRILPFRFIAAARYAPTLEPELEGAMFRGTSELPKLKGKTIILIDISGSMDAQLSAKSDMNRIDAACGVAMICREICDDAIVYTFSNGHKVVPSRRGFALRDAVHKNQEHGGTDLGEAIQAMNQMSYDRLIVFTDEQSHDRVGKPNGLGYMINVSNNQNGVGYGSWVHFDGFSESIISFISEYEQLSE